MANLTILHLTDVHFGQSAMAGRWPSVKAQLLEDLAHVVDQVGTIDLIAFTGDISNRGEVAEFDEASRFLEEIGLFLLERGAELPRLAAVPGNHDLVRPSSRPLTQIVLEDSWSAEIERSLFDDSAGELRLFIDDLFGNYTQWLKSQPLPLVNVTNTGFLPGDYSASLSAGGLNLGIVGLNSTFRHLSDRAKPSALTLSPRQINEACGGDLPKWSQSHDLCIALSHHPLSWIDAPEEARDALFNGAAKAKLHLCGHLHLESYSQQALGSSASYVTHQGQSVFGLEHWGPDAEGKREHGYALLEVGKDEVGVNLRVWPREARMLSTGQWQIDRKADFGLPRGEERSDSVLLSRATVSQTPPQQPTDAADVSIDAESHEGVPSDEQSRVNFLRDLARGTMLCVIGDRNVEQDGDLFRPIEACRTDLWAELQLGVEDDATSTEHLLSLVSARSATRAKEITSYYFGRPTETAMHGIRDILRAPWSACVYMAPSADLELAIEADSSLSNRYRYVDAFSSPFRIPNQESSPLLRLATRVPEAGVVRLVIGSPASDPGTSISSWWTYARRLATRHDVVYLTDTFSTTVWQFLSARSSGRSDFQGKAYLVCETVPPQYAASFDNYKVEWIKSSVYEFTQKYLLSSRQEVAEGLQRQSRRKKQEGKALDLSLDHRIASAGDGSRDYLLGSSPTWGDVVNGYSAELSLSERIRTKVSSSDPKSVHVVSGTAGCGRTTALMRCALALREERHSVGWVDKTVSHSIGAILEHQRRQAFDFIIFDDVDMFGPELLRMLAELRAENPETVVLLGVRSTREYLLDSLPGSEFIRQVNLTKSDVNALVDKLREYKAVANRRLSDHDIRRLILETSDGQLLVGMIQATSGVPFNQKIASECDQLDSKALAMYGSLAIASAERASMTEDQLLEAAAGEPNLGWSAFNRLLSARLIVKDPSTGRFELRHRVVAEEVREYLRQRGMLAVVVKNALRAFAAAAADVRPVSDPDRKALIRILNHSYLIGLQLHPREVREIYDEVEEVMDHDFHYWLQRGSFEVEAGDEASAMHDLTSAMTISGGEDDAKVMTEFAYFRLRLARRVRTLEANRLALEAIQDLHKVILRNGIGSPHTFAVLASEGTAWLELESLGRSETSQLAGETARLLSLGARLDDINPAVAKIRAPAIARMAALTDRLTP